MKKSNTITVNIMYVCLLFVMIFGDTQGQNPVLLLVAPFDFCTREINMTAYALCMMFNVCLGIFINRQLEESGIDNKYVLVRATPLHCFNRYIKNFICKAGTIGIIKLIIDIVAAVYYQMELLQVVYINVMFIVTLFMWSVAAFMILLCGVTREKIFFGLTVTIILCIYTSGYNYLFGIVTTGTVGMFENIAVMLLIKVVLIMIFVVGSIIKCKRYELVVLRKLQE